MSAINWDGLSTAQDWGNLLRSLLGQTEVAIREGDSARLQQLQDTLLQFIERSPAMCRPLSDVADTTCRSVFTAQMGLALQGIAARKDELEAAITAILKGTGKAQTDARALRLLEVISVLDKSREGMIALSELERAMDQPDQDLLQRIQGVCDAIDRFKKVAGEAPGSLI